MLARSVILKTAGLKPVERSIRSSRLFRSLVKRFIAGEELAEALLTAERIMERGLRVSLDYLGENTRTEPEANAAKATYIATLDAIAVSNVAKHWHHGGAEPLNISIKLTQCGLDLGDAFAMHNLREVLAAAKEDGNFVRIDMESSPYVERTIQFVEQTFPEFGNVGTVVQSYLYRTDEDLERLIKLGCRVRLVKGAYLEPPEIAFASKSKVDEAYVRQMRVLLERGNYPAIATHDADIIEETIRFAKERQINSSKFEFQMLYGIRRDLQERLHREGYNVRVYVPFGEAWYPYFTRRLAERPANAAFILRALFKG